MDEGRKALQQSEYLPFDVIGDQILPKLPVKSLVRFTSVCKTWCAAIKSPYFAAAHLNLNRSQNKGRYLLVCEQNSYRILNDDDASTELAKFDFPFTLALTRPPQDCYGLLLLCHRSTSTDSNHYYSLFNPLIRKFKTFDTDRFYERPNHYHNPLRNFASTVYGLGFHEPTNDHRVVRIRYNTPDGSHYSGQMSDMPAEVDVFSLRTDSWHRVYSNPDQFIGLPVPKGVFVQGSVHWLGCKKLEDSRYFLSLVLFDFVEESFKEMELSIYFNCISDPVCVQLIEFKGSLAAIVLRGLLYLWVMTEYGVSESWSDTLYFDFDVPWPLGFTKCGIFMFKDNEDPETMWGVFTDVANGRLSVKFIQGCNHSGYTQAFDLMESLPLLGG